MKLRHSSFAIVAALALGTAGNGAESRAPAERAVPPVPPTPAAVAAAQPAEPPATPDAPELPDIAEMRAAAEAHAAGVAETIRGHVEHAARDAERQLAGLRGGLSRLRTNLGETYVQGGGPNVFRSLVLPLGDEPRDPAAIKEELAIMGRLIQKSLQPESERKSNPFRFEFAGIHLGGRNDLDALYLEGYGVVFFIEVDYPLAAAPVREDKPSAPRPEKDDAWEQAKREVRGEPDPEDEEASGLAAFAVEPRPYDAARVDALRERLVEALRQARNLKCLRESETVTLVVSGTSPKEGNHRKGRTTVTTGRGAGPQVFVLESPGTVPGGSVMTLRVARTDLDALGSGRLKPEDFASRVRAVNRIESVGEPDLKSKDSTRVRRPDR